LKNLEATLPTCAGSEYPECTLQNLVNEGNYVNQVSCPVSDTNFLTCLLQGEGLVDADGEPIEDMVADYATALGLGTCETPDLDTILEYGPTVFSRTVCLSQQCQALKAAQEGICEELDETLTRMHTSLPECAAEVNSDLCVNKCGHRCSVDNAMGCPLYGQRGEKFVMCMAKKEGLVNEDDGTPNMDAIRPIVNALGLEMPPEGAEGFLKKGWAIVNAVTELAQECFPEE